MDSNSAFSIGINVVIEQVKDGVVLSSETYHNKVTNLGIIEVHKFLYGSAADNTITQLAMGTGSSTPTINDAVLEEERFREIVTRRQITQNNLELRHYIISDAYANITFREAGLIMRNGVLFSRVVFSPLVKTPGVSIVFTWTVQAVST